MFIKLKTMKLRPSLKQRKNKQINRCIDLKKPLCWRLSAVDLIAMNLLFEKLHLTIKKRVKKNPKQFFFFKAITNSFEKLW